MVYRYETFRDDKGIVVLQSLKVSHLSIISNRFYETSKSKNWICELCTFSQIRSHIQLYIQIEPYLVKQEMYVATSIHYNATHPSQVNHQFNHPCITIPISF